MKLTPNFDSFINPRRIFFKKFIAGSMALLPVPMIASNHLSQHPTLKLQATSDKMEESYWEMVKKQFSVTDKLIMMNAANLCPSPYFINDQVTRSFQGLQGNLSFQYRSVFKSEREEAIQALSAYLGVEPEEVGITRNTSESNNIIVHGLDLKKGDEILLWDQNHPSNADAWEVQSRRLGFTVKKVTVPESPNTIEDLVIPFNNAITPNTKLISFSHISNTSGIAMPAKEICQLAKTRKVLTMIDGAQAFGILNLNLQELGCDFYTGSTHKWLMGPLENGVIYIRKEIIENVWPFIVSAGWKDSAKSVDEKFCMLGQRNETTGSGLPHIIKFHTSLGKKDIEDRVKYLNSYLKEQLQHKLPTLRIKTPLSGDLSAGVTIIEIPGRDTKDIFQKLYDHYGIACAPTGGLRISPHIYNTKEDVDKLVHALIELMA